MKAKSHRKRGGRWMLAGLAAVLIIGGHARDAGALCNAAVDFMFVGGPNFVVPGDATRDTVRLRLTLGAGTATRCPTPPGCQLTLNRLRFDLDCALEPPPPSCTNCTPGVSFPCTDQGPVVSYGGDSTVTTDCGVSWSTNAPGGGSAANEIVFTASTPITIPAPMTDFCHLEFDLIVENSEPTSGAQSDTTPFVIEEVFGFRQAALFADADASCNNLLQVGNIADVTISACPPCVSDECTDRMCPDTGPDAGTCVGTPKVGQPCTDTDGNACTIAGCEASPTDPTAGVCVQTHTFASDGAPCPDTDGLACTTAGCDGQGVCDQSHVSNCQAATGCSVTAGGVAPNGNADAFGGTSTGTFGGQVGAPCGCIGCSDSLDQVKGTWHSRNTGLGTFHATGFDSLVCGCEDLNGGTVMLDGTLCGNGSVGHTPPAAANVACFTGVGQLSPTPMRERARTVAFRVDVEDRDERGAAKRSGPSADVYRLRIWVPAEGETAADLAAAACCNNPDPTLRPPDVDEGGPISNGDIQIRDDAPFTKAGECPPPSGTCVTTP